MSDSEPPPTAPRLTALTPLAQPIAPAPWAPHAALLPPASADGQGPAFLDYPALRDLWATVRRRRWWVLGVFLVTVGLVVQHVWRERPIYAAVLTVRIEQTPNPIADAQPITPQYDYRVDPLASEQQVIKSRTVARRAVEAITVPNRPALAPSAVDSAARDLQTRVITRVLPQTDIIEITVVGPDSVWDRVAADAVARVYGEYSREQAQIRAHGRSAFIAQSLADQALSLARSQDSLQAFQVRHQTSDAGAEQTEAFKQIYKLLADRDALAVQQRLYVTLLGKLERTDSADDGLRALVAADSVAHNRSVSSLYDSWMELLRTRQRLLLSRTERNIDVQVLDSTIAATKRNLQLSSALYLKSVGARIASLDSNVAALRQQAQRYPSVVGEQARLAAVVKTRETGYDNLLSQYQLAKISEGGETGVVRMLDQATALPDPVFPHRTRSLLEAMVVGLLLGVGMAVLVDRLDASVRDPDEISERLHLPILASIPRVRAGLSGLAGLVGGGAASGRTSMRLRLVAHQEPHSVVAEAFRALRTNIAFARAHEDLRTIVVTSAAPGDGKSTAAINLATTFAQQGQRTLLIDGDLRRAVADETFGIARAPGLSDVLVGTASLADVARPVDVPNLTVMASGPFPPNPSELLGSRAMRALLAEAKDGGAFDMIVIDSPPVLAVTDASVVASVVDGAILVIRLGVTPREAVRRAVTQLRAVNGHLIGAVVNDVSPRDGAYGQYAYYYGASRQPQGST